ncbi:MAG: bifunctional adenosylcobinamide kinase/adenosylcobinamide-phosphate guanylyltransferase [Ruminococcus sp.]|nr:bifunctional adenosylcobinamide kinase/adenosylcobinamide-phosphate guanylyltransferase [Ruminococcus sp.]
MKFIVGGAFQGKTEFAVKNFGISEAEITDVGKCSVNQFSEFTNVKNYHSFIRTLMDMKIDPIEFTNVICEKKSDMVIIMNEVGCGIIPMDEKERKWREICGKCGCIIAENSEIVVRVICGIGTVIKGDNACL